MSDDDELLPLSSPQQDQERRSFARFQVILPSCFIFREETGGDFGTDRVLELRDNNGAVTNVRLHVQGKSALALNPNPDGSFSYPLPVKSINYLQHQLGSIFILYLEDRDCFKWAWASDVVRAMKARNDRRRRQPPAKPPGRETVFTHRFVRDLDKAAFGEIYATARRYGSIVARLSDIVASSSETKPGDAFVSLLQGEVTDVALIEQQLREQGLSLASSGLNNVVDDALGKLPGRVRDDPELQCVIAFSKLMQGDAAAALALVRAESAGEPPQQRQLRKVIHATAEHMLGLVDISEYARRLEESRALAPDTALTAQFRLHELRERLFANKARDLDSILPLMREIVESVVRRRDLGEDVKLSVELVLWDMDALLIQRLKGEVILGPRVRETIVGLVGADEARVSAAAVARLSDQVARWHAKGEELRRRVAATGNLLFSARFYMSIANSLSTEASATPTLADSAREPINSLNGEMMVMARKLVDVGCFEIAARVEIVRSDLAILLDDGQGARTALEAALAHARRIGSRWLEHRAEEGLAGRGILAGMQAARKRMNEPSNPRSEAERAAAMSAADRDHHAAQFLRMAGLPPDRYFNVRKAQEAVHVIARERLNWCRHLGYGEDSNDELCATDPHLYGRCALLEHESSESCTDIGVIVQRFKADFCRTCPSRAPWSDDDA